MRTYDRKTYLAAKAAWDCGSFREEWTTLRSISWERGFAYPPAGSPEDDREDDFPSQRAIVHAALLDRPIQTLGIVRRATSWSEVVSRIIRAETVLRAVADQLDRQIADAKSREPSRSESALALANLGYWTEQ